MGYNSKVAIIHADDSWASGASNDLKMELTSHANLVDMYSFRASEVGSAESVDKSDSATVLAHLKAMQKSGVQVISPIAYPADLLVLLQACVEHKQMPCGKGAVWFSLFDAFEASREFASMDYRDAVVTYMDGWMWPNALDTTPQNFKDRFASATHTQRLRAIFMTCTKEVITAGSPTPMML